jgi:uncharacterized membrane protein
MMTTLSVLKFNTPDGAEHMSGLLQQMQRQQLITIHDAAIVTWPQGKKKPKTKQLHHLAGIGAVEGAFWGMLFGLLFFVPFLGMAVGAGMGALMASMADVGISDKFIKQVQSQVTEGTSALFLLTSGAIMDRIMQSVREQGLHFELISTNLSAEEEQKLRDVFSSEPEAAPQ